MNIQLGHHLLLIHTEVFDILEKFTQYTKDDPESGGIIIGKLTGDEINILKLSIPTVLDRASRSNFERSKIGAQIILDYEFHNSNGQLTYLGEWHTHPEKHPTPSFTDLNMLKNQLKHNKLHVNFILLLIKGTESLYIRLIDSGGIYESKI